MMLTNRAPRAKFRALNQDERRLYSLAPKNLVFSERRVNTETLYSSGFLRTFFQKIATALSGRAPSPRRENLRAMSYLGLGYFETFVRLLRHISDAATKPQH